MLCTVAVYACIPNFSFLLQSSAFAQPLLSTTNCDSLSSFPGFSFASPTPVSVQSVQPANTPPNVSSAWCVKYILLYLFFYIL